MSTDALVLAVEDEESDALLLQLAAEAAHFPPQLLVLRDGQELLNYLTRKEPFGDEARFAWPKLLLLDLKMPTVDGFEVLAWLREHSEIPRVPVIVFSASACEADRNRALKLGASDFLSKPSQFRVLVQMMQQLNRQWLSDGQSEDCAETRLRQFDDAREPDFSVPSASTRVR